MKHQTTYKFQGKPETVAPEPETDPVKELAYEWLCEMQNDPRYLEEAFGDLPVKQGLLFHYLHGLTYRVTSEGNEQDRMACVRDLVDKVLGQLAMKKAEMGEELP